jgi:CHAT domain-containing protein/Flp pilus assembly protein TadD
LLVFSVSCNRGEPPDPQRAYRQVQLTFLQGDLGKATLQAEEGYQHYSGKSREWSWQFRLLQAKILTYRRLSKEALSMLNLELPADLSHGDLAIRKEMVQGLALARLGRNQEADHHLSEAQYLCDLTHSSLAGELADTNGVVAFGREDFPAAEDLFRKSLQFARQQKDQLLEITALLNLGSAALKQQHYDESILWSTDAYRSAGKLGAHFAEQKALGNLGWAYYMLGDLDKSIAFFHEAADEARSLDARSDLVKWIRSLGMVSRDTGELPAAEDYYKQSLALAQQSEDKEDLADAMTAIAAVSVERKEWDQATRYSQQAINLCRANGDRAGELDAMLVEGKIAASEKEAGRAMQLFHEVSDDPLSEVPLKWEAEDLLGRLYEDQHRPADAQRHYRIAIGIFESARSSLQKEEFRLPFLTNGVQLYDDEIHFLVTQGATAEALQLADYSRAQTLAEGLGVPNNRRGPRPSFIGNAQNTAAKTSATILFYWLGPRYSYLWAVTRDHTKLAPLPLASVINTLVRNYRKELEGPRDVLETGNKNGRDLYDILVAPAREEVAENPRTIIIPDGALNNLNFDTLLVPEPGLHYLIDDTTILNASSLRLLAASSYEARSATPKLLLIGDPVTPNREYGDLPNAVMEMGSVEKHFAPSDRKVFARAEATNQAYLSGNLKQFSYIHFVAHAAASRLSPLDSAVILSKSTSEDDSFKLYARDIVRRPVQADLVTISTCYGAGTRAYTGEGLVGLSWAFMRAGAHNVIGALWEVSDSSTPQLMDHLYGELADGRDPDVALRAAKLALLHSNSVFRKPFYWAPFQLYTDQVTVEKTQVAGTSGIRH